MDDMLNLIERLENFKIENFDKETAENTQRLIEDAMWALRKLYSYKVQPEPEPLTTGMRQRLMEQNAEQRLELIKDCVVDWDGYRSASGLGSLLNEVWTYATFPCKNEAQMIGYYDLGAKELYCNSGTERPVWLEYLDRDELRAAIMVRPNHMTEWDNVVFFLNATYPWIQLNLRDYNKTWRVWDDKPTIARRNEVEWETE